MSQGLIYTPMAEAELPAVTRLIVHAFAGTADGTQEWLKGSGLEHIRVVKAGADLPAESCLLRVPMAQFFGGRSVSMLGVAGAKPS